MAAQPDRKDRIEEIGHEPDGGLDGRLARRLAALRDRAELRHRLQRAHARRRVSDVVAWPAGRACPDGRLREAWVAYRYGLDAVAEGGTAAAGRRSTAVAGRARYAVELYERFAERRPRGWPESGPAALLALASQRRAASFAGDVARLLILAKQMRAAALEHDRERLQRAVARAARRTSPPNDRLGFRRPGLPRWEAPEQQRQRVRDQVLLAGGDPALWPNAALASDALAADPAAAPALTGPDPFEALDSIGARAERYRAEFARGRFQLPPAWRQITPATET